MRVGCCGEHCVVQSISLVPQRLEMRLKFPRTKLQVSMLHGLRCLFLPEPELLQRLFAFFGTNVLLWRHLPVSLKLQAAGRSGRFQAHSQSMLCIGTIQPTPRSQDQVCETSM